MKRDLHCNSTGVRRPDFANRATFNSEWPPEVASGTRGGGEETGRPGMSGVCHDEITCPSPDRRSGQRLLAYPVRLYVHVTYVIRRELSSVVVAAHRTAGASKGPSLFGWWALIPCTSVAALVHSRTDAGTRAHRHVTRVHKGHKHTQTSDMSAYADTKQTPLHEAQRWSTEYRRRIRMKTADGRITKP